MSVLCLIFSRHENGSHMSAKKVLVRREGHLAPRVTEREHSMFSGLIKRAGVATNVALL